jgi:NTE family protein
MKNITRMANLVLAGGGVKGIAYVGAFEAAEESRFYFRNIGGVSAGALLGSLYGAGYKSFELRKMLYEFGYDKVKIEDIPKKVPAVGRFIELYDSRNYHDDKVYKEFLLSDTDSRMKYSFEPDFAHRLSIYRGNLYKNLITYCKEGCLFDGDYLEEWVYKQLVKAGIKTFEDIRGRGSISNPKGYKVRMTAADLSRGKVIVLPDDITYYGVNPDKLEVASAVRMSTSVPFAFKPVELYKKQKDLPVKKHYIVDGGILDNFPLWLVNQPGYMPLIGLRMIQKKKKLLDFLNPLNVMKGLVSVAYNFGIPKVSYSNSFIAGIDTGDISFLDFDLSDAEKEFLVRSGKKSSLRLFNKIIQRDRYRRYNFFEFFRRVLGAGW